MVHARQQTAAGLAALRDLIEPDIDRVIDYWHGGGADLEFLGVDRHLLGTPDDTRARYLRALRTGNPDQANIAFAVTLDDEFVGYTLLNQYTPETNYSHWHIAVSDKRARGLSTALYPHRIKMYFDSTNMARLIHQTRTRNIGVNRMLDKFLSVAETVFVEKPDGVALPGEFNIRYVQRDDIPRLFARTARE